MNIQTVSLTIPPKALGGFFWLDNEPVLCRSFVEQMLGQTKDFTVQVATVRPHRKGWKKVVLRRQKDYSFGRRTFTDELVLGYATFLTAMSYSILTARFGNTFWFKIVA